MVRPYKHKKGVKLKEGDLAIFQELIFSKIISDINE